MRVPSPIWLAAAVLWANILVPGCPEGQWAAGPSLVVTETAHVTVEPADTPVVAEPVEAPPQRSEGCGCGENCPCREAGGECRCGDPPIPDKTLEAIEAYHEEVESHESDSVSSNGGSASSVSGKPHSSGSLQQEGGDGSVLEAASNKGYELVAIFADWCAPCRPLKPIAATVPGVRVLDWDREQAECLRLWEGARVKIALPAFVQLKDGVPTGARWVGNAAHGRLIDAAELEARRVYQGQPPRMAAAPQYERTPEISMDQPAPPWALRIDISPPGSSGAVRGSGFVIGKQGDEWIGMTCSHVVRATNYRHGERLRVKSNGYWLPARLLRDDQRSDLALIAFRHPVESHRPAILDVATEAPKDGSTVEMHGYISGIVYRYLPTTLRYNRTPGTYSTDARSIGGESGGAVTGEGGLVGVISMVDVHDNPDHGGGMVIDLPSIRAFLNLPARDVASPGPVPPSRASHTGRGGVPHLSKTPMVGLAEATPRPAYSTR